MGVELDGELDEPVLDVSETGATGGSGAVPLAVVFSEFSTAVPTAFALPPPCAKAAAWLETIITKTLTHRI
jgi:hypothetical protein